MAQPGAVVAAMQGLPTWGRGTRVCFALLADLIMLACCMAMAAQVGVMRSISSCRRASAASRSSSYLRCSRATASSSWRRCFSSVASGSQPRADGVS